MTSRLRARRRSSVVAVGVVALVAGLTALLWVTPSAAVAVCNTTPIQVDIPPPPGLQEVRRALPYPSTINVAGLAGTVTDVDVQLNGIAHPFPEDLDVLLVAPDGTTNLLVMSDDGGNNLSSNLVSGVNLYLTDQAASPIPANTLLSSGTFQPFNDNTDPDEFVPNHADPFFAPAPTTPSTATMLSVFNGLSPNGTWSLYVVDDEPGPAMPAPQGLLNGWCIDINGTGPTTTTTGPTTTTTAPTTTTTTAPTTTTTGPTTTTTTGPTTTTTTTAPTTTTTTAPTTTTTSPATTTTTTPSTTTTVPTTTSTTAPTTTTTAPPIGLTCFGQQATIVGTPGNDSINGTPRNDVIVALGGNDSIDGRGGGDLICAGDGADNVSGGTGADTVSGGSGNDNLLGSFDDDNLQGDDGSDILLGESGNDAHNGGNGSDLCKGDGGINTYASCETVINS